MIGALRNRYDVASRDAARYSRGERSSVYTKKFTTWGEPMREGSVSANSELGSIRSEATFRLRVRWRPQWWTEFLVGDRLVDRKTGVISYIAAPPTEIGNRQWLQLVISQSPVP